MIFLSKSKTTKEVVAEKLMLNEVYLKKVFMLECSNEVDKQDLFPVILALIAKNTGRD